MAFAPPWTYSPISGLPWAPAVRPIPAEPGAVRTAGSAPLLFENSTFSVEEWPRRSPPSLNGQQERCPSTTQIHSTAPNPVSVEVPKLLHFRGVPCPLALKSNHADSSVQRERRRRKNQPRRRNRA